MPKLFDFDEVPCELKGEAEALIVAALAQHKAAAVTKPLMIHMCGIPGSGKTTYATKFLQDHNYFSLVQFDTIMESLAGYQKEREEHGIEQAFSRWELPARAIGYHLLQALVEAKRNVFFDHSATNRKHIDLISAVKAEGYLVEMHFIECSVAEATRRVKERETKLQRHTPLGLIGERNQLLKELLPQYELLVDKFIRTPS
ncbi:hypothetical protein BH11CYA1_BH11CYA1_36860 [soil metagenome]